MAAARKLLITTTVSAALLAGCNSSPVAKDGSWETSEDTKVCRDKNGNRTDDVNCEYAARSGVGGVGGAFMWMYLARGSRVPGIGRAITTGSTMKAPGVAYSSASSIERSGFGRSSGGSFRSAGG